MDIWTSEGFEYVWNTVDFSRSRFAPRKNYMYMPDTRLVIAPFYNRPITLISMAGSAKCFPFWSGPK